MRIFCQDETAARALAKAGLAGAVAWSDPLHCGRTPAWLDLERYALERAEELARFGWESESFALADLRLRGADARAALASGEPLVLAFEPAPAGVLAQAQCLAWLAWAAAEAAERIRLADVWTAKKADRAAVEEAIPASPESWQGWQALWHAFACGDPGLWAAAWRRSELPAGARTAFERILQELPSAESGLSLTQAQILDALRLEVRRPRELFEAVAACEPVPLYNDWQFWRQLDRLCAGSRPLAARRGGGAFICPPRDFEPGAFEAQELELTAAGLAALEGELPVEEVAAALPPARLGGACLGAGAAPRLWDYAAKSFRRGAGTGEGGSKIEEGRWGAGF